MGFKKKNNNSLKYVITSHPKYTKALEFMLDSMVVAKVPLEDIIVVLGDCDTSGKYINEKIKIRPGITYIPVENNLYEYNFFIGVIKAIKMGVAKRIDDFVLLHDTCLTGKYFLENVKRLQNFSEQIVWNNKYGSYNIGLFRYQAIKEGYNLYKNLTNLSKHDAIMMEHNKNHLSPKRFVVSQKYQVGTWQKNTKCLNNFDVYNEKRNRTTVYIPCMDLLKFFFWVPHGNVHPNNLE